MIIFKCRVDRCDMYIHESEKTSPYCLSCIKERDALIAEHNAAIHKVAIDEMRFGLGSRLGDVDDCYQVAMVAFMRAFDLFNPNQTYLDKQGYTHNVKFISYAVASMKRCLHMNCQDSGVMHVPHQEVSKAANDVNKTRNNSHVVYRALDISSLDAIPNRDEELVDYHWDSDEFDEMQEKLNITERALARLKDPRDRQIVHNRIFKNMTLIEIGEELNIGKERVRQLYNRSVMKMQEFFRVPVKQHKMPNKLGMKTNKRDEPEKLGVLIQPNID